MTGREEVCVVVVVVVTVLFFFHFSCTYVCHHCVILIL